MKKTANRAKRLVTVACLLACGSAIAACLGHTEIKVVVQTNVTCSAAPDWQGIAIYVGPPGGDLKLSDPATGAAKCPENGKLGELVVVPSSSSDPEVAITVVAGVSRKPEDCADSGNYAGCIVARRRLRYLPHESEPVTIDLTTDCLARGCGAYTTCINGACVDSSGPIPPVLPDGGDATLPPLVRCGDNGQECPADDPNQVCCVTFDMTAKTSKGDCRLPHDCPSSSATLHCDDSADCPVGTADNPFICQEILDSSVTPARVANTLCGARKSNVNGAVTVMCQDRGPCPGTGGACGPDSAAPGYFTCQS